MKTVKTFVVEFKSGRIEKVFASSLEDLKQMITFDMVKTYKVI
jgi:hypothetical protein